MKILENKTRAKNALFAAGTYDKGAWAKFIQSAVGVFAGANQTLTRYFT